MRTVVVFPDPADESQDGTWLDIEREAINHGARVKRARDVADLDDGS